MNRQIYTIRGPDDEYRSGWFDLDAATVVADENREWDGGNMISKATGSELVREQLLRTAGGEYIIRRVAGTGPRATASSWSSSTDAEEWMRRQGLDEAADAEFPAAERIPRGVGRSREGTAITVRIPDAHLAALDTAAAASGTTRAALIRSAVAERIERL